MSESKSFFTTLPGILTGLAALITAVAGLVYALSETGVIGRKSTSQPSAQQPTSGQATSPVPQGRKFNRRMGNYRQSTGRQVFRSRHS